MTIEAVVRPSGRIRVLETEGDSSTTSDATAAQDTDLMTLMRAFESSTAEGLIALAARPPDESWHPSLAYWRDLAARYLAKLCTTPEDAAIAPVSPPTSAECAGILLSVPPMTGAEYLTSELLESVWKSLDDWVRETIAGLKSGLPGFLERYAPLWHQVGRVCFHLAENRRDPDHPFAFLATYSPRVGKAGRVQYQPLSKALQEYAGAKNRNVLVRLLSPVQRASEQSELIRDLVESREIYHPLAWTPRQAYRFLKEVPLFEKSGILVRLPDWWKKRPRPRVNVTIGDTKQQKFDARALLSFHVGMALGDQKLTEDEWRQLMAAEDGLVLLKGQWVEVNHERLAEALDHWRQVERQSEDGLSFIQGMRLLAGTPIDLAASEDEERQEEWSFVQAGQWLGEVLKELRSPDTIRATSPATSLKATLRPYQETGHHWLVFMTQLGLGACLADDMGLGKTIQVLSLLLTRKEQGNGRPSLLVLPASLLANWKSEMERFAPSLKASFVHPSELSKDAMAQLSSAPGKAFSGIDVVLTTYGMLLRQKWLNEVDWQLVVLDEAQAIKNPGSRQTKAVKRLQATARIALTGTPVENRLGDLWSLFDFLCPGLLGSQKKFKDFIKSLQQREHDQYKPLRNLVQPYILRRLKTDKRIIADLPEKTEVRAFCGLTKKQASLYARLVRELSDALENQDGMKRRGLVLAYLMRFKQLCNHPSQLLGDGVYATEESGKYARLREICEEIASRQERVLIFTQFREMTEPLAGFLATVFGQSGLILHGGTAVKKRKQIVEAFQSDDGPPFLILSLKAGGTGLNLTAASHVVHFDRWWNPAVENQATDRAFRIGQKRNVLVHKFVCRGTVEERIDSLIEEKTQIATDVLEGGGETLLTELSNEELIDLVSLDVNRAQV